MPDEYISLDGNSLNTDDLLQLGMGKYKIRLTNESEARVVKARKMAYTR